MKSWGETGTAMRREVALVGEPLEGIVGGLGGIMSDPGPGAGMRLLPAHREPGSTLGSLGRVSQNKRCCRR